MYKCERIFWNEHFKSFKKALNFKNWKITLYNGVIHTCLRINNSVYVTLTSYMWELSQKKADPVGSEGSPGTVPWLIESSLFAICSSWKEAHF